MKAACATILSFPPKSLSLSILARTSDTRGQPCDVSSSQRTGPGYSSPVPSSDCEHDVTSERRLRMAHSPTSADASYNMSITGRPTLANRLAAARPAHIDARPADRAARQRSTTSVPFMSLHPLPFTHRQLVGIGPGTTYRPPPAARSGEQMETRWLYPGGNSESVHYCSHLWSRLLVRV
jgi:hypothetical protein